jgi:hypothetical protein
MMTWKYRLWRAQNGGYQLVTIQIVADLAADSVRIGIIFLNRFELVLSEIRAFQAAVKRPYIYDGRLAMGTAHGY